MWFLLAAILLVLLGASFVLWQRVRRQRRLHPGSAQRYIIAWQKLASIPDEHRRVLEAEKIVESAFRELGYNGTFADALREHGVRFAHIEQLWRAHKLRNRIAHEMHVQLTEREVADALNAFERTLKQLF